MNVCEQNLDSSNQNTFYNDFTFFGLEADSYYLDNIYIDTFAPSNTLASEVYTFALESQLLKYDVPCYFNIVKINAMVCEKAQVVFAFVMQANLPEIISQTLRYKVQIFKDDFLRYEATLKCCSIDTELKTAIGN